MDIDKVVFVEMSDNINYSGEVVGDSFFKEGIILKTSGNSNIKVWLPIKRIDNIYFPDKSKLTKDESNLKKLFNHMKEVKLNKRSLNHERE